MPMIALSGPERLQLRSALQAAYLPNVFPDLLQALDKDPAEFGGMGTPYPDLVMAVVRHAETDGWLLDLIRKAVELRNNLDPDLNEWRTELTTRQPPAMAIPARVFDACCLSGSHLLVDRRRLRAALRSLVAPAGKRILVVRDDPPPADPFQAPKTGKSHTLQMVAYLSLVQGTFDFIEIDLQPMAQAISTIRPIDLARRLFKKLGYTATLSEPTDSAWDRWNIEFCDDLEVLARQRQRPIWIVIDSFNLVLLPTPTVGLLREIAVRINRQLANVRLVLLGYGDTLPSHVSAMIEEEKIAPIGETELIEFFATAFPERNLPVTDETIADAVERVFERIDPRQPDFLIKLPPVIEDQLQPQTSAAGRPPAWVAAPTAPPAQPSGGGLST
jgi:hypothetical protein